MSFETNAKTVEDKVYRLEQFTTSIWCIVSSILKNDLKYKSGSEKDSKKKKAFQLLDKVESEMSDLTQEDPTFHERQNDFETIVRAALDEHNNQDHIFKHDIWQRYMIFEESNSVEERRQNLQKQIKLLEQKQNTEKNTKRVRWLKFQLRYIQSQVFRDFLKQDDEYQNMPEQRQHYFMKLFVEHFSTMEEKKMLFDLDMIQNPTRINKNGNVIDIPKFELEDEEANPYSVRALLEDRRAKWTRLQETNEWKNFQDKDKKKNMNSDAKKKIEEELKNIFRTPPCWLSVYGPMCGFERVKAAWKKAIKSDPQDNWENEAYYLEHTNVNGSRKHYIIGNKMSSYSDTTNSYHLEFD